MPLTIDLLRDADVADAVALSTGEGWNQTDADWRRILRLGPGGCFAARVGGRLVGTVTTTIYERALAWIGMMIVHPAARRQGIGAALMSRALEHLDAAGVACVKLDATPAGQPLYRRLGFEEEMLFERWMGVAARVGGTAPAPDERAALGPILPLDRAAFGADRSRFLAELESEALAAYVVREPEREGYALAREGRIATYLGPVVSTDDALAARLVDTLLTRFSGRQVCIDVNSTGLLDPAHLVARGLAPRRPLARMRRGGSTGSGTPATLCASAGPEYG
ncbi:MAG TPA: GNAT family N-acetyltransferase [Gemmatimonadaceae bacterium]|nr:GNAT family N-acetyltransferase [Gemmatimonadaceae bacterium]